MNRSLSQPLYRIIAAVVFVLLTSALHAQTIPVAESGFTLTIPEDFKLITLDSSAVLLQANSPSGDSSVQVVTGVPDAPVRALVGDYEMKMSMVFSNLVPLSEEMVAIGANSHLLKRYSAKSDAGKIWITTLYYTTTGQTMIVHVVDLTGDGDKMKAIVTSFTPRQSELAKAAPAPKPPVEPPPASKPPAAKPHSSKSAVSLSAATSSASTDPLPAPIEDYHWFAEKTSGLRMEIPKNWQVEIVDSRIVFVPPKDDPLYQKGGLQVQNLSRSLDMYKTIELASQDILNFVDALKGTYLQNSYQQFNGLNCRLIEFQINLDKTEYRHLWVLFVERPETITLLQFDAVGQKDTVDAAAALIKPHVLKGLDSIREL